MLQPIFEKLCGNYTSDMAVVCRLWEEIELAYTDAARHYHTIAHLENMYQQLEAVKESIKEWDLALFALFYHDIIYKATKSNNEEKSAGFAQQRLEQLGIADERIHLVTQSILATKKHQPSGNEDINYFTDADLSILGSSWQQYDAYRLNVRKEYGIYPDIIYKPGRRKVLEHFIAMPAIYKTAFFSERFEQNAKANLTKERNL